MKQLENYVPEGDSVITHGLDTTHAHNREDSMGGSPLGRGPNSAPSSVYSKKRPD